ncbi:MAG: RCC1 repeat-containing protein [Kofleriaceae bacterium]
MVLAVMVAAAGCGRIGFDDRLPSEIDAQRARALAMGGKFSCALRDARVWCWGDNASGQLGATDGVPRPTPVEIAGLNNIRSIDAGDAYACALDDAGDVWCWGENEDGQLGRPSSAPSSIPQRVTLPQPASQITAGAKFACARLVDGRAWCWGRESHSQILGAPLSGDIPPTQQPLENVIAIEAGRLHTGAILADGTVWTWGYVAHGRLGRDGEGDEAIQVPGMAEVVELSLSEWTCARDRNNGVQCWGKNFDGQLGDGESGTERSEAASPIGLPAAVSLSTGDAHTCAIADDQQVWCWGANDNGQLGVGDRGTRVLPQRVGLGVAVALDADGSHTCAVLDDGSIWCWGRGSNGELGNGTLGAFTPHAIDLGAPAIAVSAGERHTCATTSLGVSCWGANNESELGDGTVMQRTVPTNTLQTNATAIAIGFQHTCAIDSAAEVYCWGDNGEGELGNGTSTSSRSPVAVTGVAQATHVGVGYRFSCQLGTPGLSCWGRGHDGQRGVNSTSSSETPAPITTASQAVSLAVGADHACITTSTEQVYCWGGNTSAQIGDGTIDNALVPTLVPVVGALGVAAGERHTCSVLRSGVMCWGENARGELGTGTGADSRVPTPTIGLPTIDNRVIATGRAATCAAAGGGIWCWGANDAGQLGDGTSRDRLSPVRVLGLGTPTSLAVGTSHACAIVAGTLWCWGDDSDGQQGRGITTSVLVPARIAFP